MCRATIKLVLLISLTVHTVNATLKTGDKSSSFESNEDQQETNSTKNPEIVQTCGQKLTCTESRYRTLDGTCNNLENPYWGAAKEPFAVLVEDARPDKTMCRTTINLVLLISLSAHAVNATLKTGDKSSSFESNEDQQETNSTKNPEIVQTCGQKLTCTESRYRTLDGTCNNLENPYWGAAKEPFAVLVEDARPDSINISAQGNMLPNPREVSLKIFPPRNFTDQKWTLNAMQWGQIIAHDISLTASTSIINVPSPTCCNFEGQYTSEANSNKFCAAIPIPNKENGYCKDKRECFDFVRTVTSNDTGCTAPDAPSYPAEIDKLISVYYYYQKYFWLSLVRLLY
ncbi:PREDICTED: uncharacterized protein LOC106104059 [Papilio polytes]|uniref:uncharacterized protein LOC106104059 n=1 Tax=Papilio polytes TaxID=76194 RepID=UPI0006767048|nr:PREDICTED: uncharacterized protein LOC106104059 [Papilio polytes]